MTLTLWGRPTSVNVQKVLWALDELGLAYDHKIVGGKYAGLDQPPFADHAPLPRVPLLMDGQQAIWESHAILRHLARRADRLGTPEVPVDMWMEFASTTVQPDFIGLFYQYVRLPLAQRNAQTQEKHRNGLANSLGAVDKHLGQNAYLAGSDFTIADIAMGCMFYRLQDVEPDLVAALPHVTAWVDRLKTRPPRIRWIASSYEELRAPGTVPA